MDETTRTGAAPAFDSAQLGALAHLYRAEIYRSTIWRSRLDITTNWAVVTTGIALSVTFANAKASAFPLVLVGLLVAVFLLFEARRYRYFEVWRVRARMLETQIYAPILRGEGAKGDGRWNAPLAQDYVAPHYRISFVRAVGRRLRRNYSWILAIQAIAYYGKLVIHPTPLVSLNDLWARAALGPVSGELMVLGGALFHGGWILLAIVSLRMEWVYVAAHRDDTDTSLVLDELGFLKWAKRRRAQDARPTDQA